jgi:DNA-binding response OmpR family regulator
MHQQQTHLIYEFGDFELDALRRVLVSRADGQQVEVTGRVLEALVYLVERPGQLVDKKTLIEALWPHVVVEEGSLPQTIHTLRHGQNAHRRRLGGARVPIQGKELKWSMHTAPFLKPLHADPRWKELLASVDSE